MANRWGNSVNCSWLFFSKITADGDCSHEIKRHLLLGRKVMTNLDSILKSRDITLPTKVCLVKALVFLVVMYECECCTTKKAEHWRIDDFELLCWRRLLRVPWSARRSLQSILKEINPGFLLEGLMLKLKLHYFGHLMRRADSFEKTLMLGKIGSRRRRGWQRMRWLDGITDSLDMGLGDSGIWWRTGRPGMLWFMGSQIFGHYWATELNWTKYTLLNKRKKYLQHSGKAASFGTKRVKYHLTGTQWYQIKGDILFKNPPTTEKKIFITKPWFFWCWRRPLTLSQWPWGSRGCSRTAEPRTASPPQTLGWL